MKIALYPGSFNPWHKGHNDILFKALDVFDKVIVCILNNSDKDKSCNIKELINVIDLMDLKDKVSVEQSNDMLIDEVAYYKPDCIIRGLRNGQDFEYEKIYQYTNEDLGLKIPFVYFLCGRDYTHISSTVERTLNKLRNKK